jgi:predicted nucleic acid-binding protein
MPPSTTTARCVPGGVTPNPADTFIATYCLETRAQLLTSDRDFLPMRDHLGLQLVPTIS